MAFCSNQSPLPFVLFHSFLFFFFYNEERESKKRLKSITTMTSRRSEADKRFALMDEMEWGMTDVDLIIGGVGGNNHNNLEANNNNNNNNNNNIKGESENLPKTGRRYSSDYKGSRRSSMESVSSTQKVEQKP